MIEQTYTFASRVNQIDKNLSFISDIEPPVFHNCPLSSYIVNSTGEPVLVNITLPLATDNSGITPVISIDPANFTTPYLVSKVYWFEHSLVFS